MPVTAGVLTIQGLQQNLTLAPPSLVSTASLTGSMRSHPVAEPDPCQPAPSSDPPAQHSPHWLRPLGLAIWGGGGGGGGGEGGYLESFCYLT